MSSSFILIGPPGSGKGTQAKMMKDHFSIPHISTGDMFRAEVAKKSELGQKLEQIMSAGKYVSDEVTNEVVKRRLSQPDTQSGFILDGYPRTLNQAKALETMIDDLDRPCLQILVFEMDPPSLIERLAGRLTCPACGAVFHKVTNPPKEPNKCDSCGHIGLELRKDDQEETVLKRLAVFESETGPLIEYYRNSEEVAVEEIDASKPVEEITEQILAEFSG